MSEVRKAQGTPAPTVDALRDQLWTIKDQLRALGYNRFADAIEAAVTLSKGEK